LSAISRSPGNTTGWATGGRRRGASLGVSKLGDAGGMYLGEVARATRVTRFGWVAEEADRWFVGSGCERVGRTARTGVGCESAT
tara:strand:+ start:440 stop:691 length:252 start_codon:yes stop_codon:yes gene_type:complete